MTFVTFHNQPSHFPVPRGPPGSDYDPASHDGPHKYNLLILCIFEYLLRKKYYIMHLDFYYVRNAVKKHSCTFFCHVR